MPVPLAFRIPRRSGTHRTAAIALYRALLSQCRWVSIGEAQHNELQNLIRNRFKQARRDQSVARLRVSFEAGYEAIDLLDAAVAGDDASKSRILKLLEEAPLKARQPPPLPLVPANKRKGSKSEERKPIATSKHSLFDRPLPLSELSGKRHVPRLINANQIPMLRIKKPQPEHLSGYIAHRVKTRQKRLDRKSRLEEELSLAEQEDDWDELVEGSKWSKGLAQSQSSWQEPCWVDALESEIGVAQRQLHEERRKNREMAEKMQAVVDRETSLFAREKAERKERQVQDVAAKTAGVGADANAP